MKYAVSTTWVKSECFESSLADELVYRVMPNLAEVEQAGNMSPKYILYVFGEWEARYKFRKMNIAVPELQGHVYTCLMPDYSVIIIVIAEAPLPDIQHWIEDNSRYISETALLAFQCPN